MIKTKMTGMKELDKKMKQLSRSAGKAVLRKTLREAAVPLVEAAQANAPKDTGGLRESISISTRLNKAQKRLEKKAGGKSSVEMYVGSSSPLAHLIEFGTAPRINGGKYAGSKHPGTRPQPFLRPAFDATVNQIIEIIKKRIAENLMAAIGRANRRAAKRNAK